MSTVHSNLKKIVIALIPIMYLLGPENGVESQQFQFIAHIEEATSNILTDSFFLHDRFDEQVNDHFVPFTQNGLGRLFPWFCGKDYILIFHGMLLLLEDVTQHEYHGLKLKAHLTEWAQVRWDAMGHMNIMDIGRHEHLMSQNKMCGYMTSSLTTLHRSLCIG
ncbi:hypothetical protein BS17DRAFT_770648 [Gyrodon lividus]|nr:hypothetical protein BS17DRAFT_770648 [Gyrodon lividus]